MPSGPVDKPQRDRALEHRESLIVQAPAGSGKTDLLTRRFLKLLAAVDEPEEILAITFTRAATAEMRGRILQDLELAARGSAAVDDERNALACAALARAEMRGWRLLEQPHRLNIDTIDSLCLRIAQNQPLLSRLGGRLAPTEHATPLYTLAARRTLGRLGSADTMLDEALKHLLALRDNRLADCVSLIAGMLARRDQWIRSFPLTRKIGGDDWDKLRSALELPLRDEVRRVHARAYELMTRTLLLENELVELVRYAIGNGNQKIATLAGIQQLPKAELLAIEHWQCIADFLLTGDAWRKPKGLNVTAGFPPGGKEEKARMGRLLEEFSTIDGLREALAAVRNTPLAHFDEEQWQTLRHVFIVLRQAIAELRVLFAERNTVDFTEVAFAAKQVLSDPSVSPETLLAVSGNIRHLLVDEFQDTSHTQYELLALLVQTWEADEGRTAFLVGDPMQSVYLFRQAEVELFELVKRVGLASESFKLRFEHVALKTNFRSHMGLTTRWNEMFEVIFSDDGIDGIHYEETVAAEQALPDEGVHVHSQILSSGEGRIIPQERERARDAEAAKVLDIIRTYLPKIEDARVRGAEYRVAVLVRAKTHLTRIAALLRTEGVPFRAIELETLNERQELLDLRSLVRALLQPMDRVAWLSVLRAPWCGLAIHDLHILTGADDKSLKAFSIPELVESRAHLLSEDGAERLHRVSGVLRQALAVRFQGPYAGSFSQWIERTWRSLGGPLCLDKNALENVGTFISMLDEISPDGMACLTNDFEAQMESLYAQPDPTVSEHAGLQLMTIHKAKGLGFDVVIVPGLDRRCGRDDSPLISWLERSNPATGETEMLAAPIGRRADDKHPTYDWVQRQRRQKEKDELKRVLYVACTRAKTSLHLIGTAELTASGELKVGNGDSMLKTAWPALKADFEAELAAKQLSVIEFPAAAKEGNALEMAAAADLAAQLSLRRLPLNADLGPLGENVPFAGIAADGAENAFERPEGSRDARHKGSVVHALLAKMSRGAQPEALADVARSLLRSLAYFGKPLDEAVEEVVTAVRNCLNDPDGAWILAPHQQAQSENSITDWKGGALETLRPDRVFLAGATPQTEGENHLWIIDYKLMAPGGADDFLKRQREIYAPQLVRYERALREAQRIRLPVRFGLYYPRIAKLDWWSTD